MVHDCCYLCSEKQMQTICLLLFSKNCFFCHLFDVLYEAAAICKCMGQTGSNSDCFTFAGLVKTFNSIDDFVRFMKIGWD